MSFSEALDQLGALALLPAAAHPDNREGRALCQWAHDEIVELRSAVLKYGHHTTDCRYNAGHDCTCGLEELRHRLRHDIAKHARQPVTLDPAHLTTESVVRTKGGQHVGIDAGVRVIHESGLVAEVRTDRSQLRNRSVAMDMILGGLTSPHFRG